jgi:exopolysaccharide production protein ExoQ
MAELTLNRPLPANADDSWLMSVSMNPRLLIRKAIFVGVLFLFSGTHNVLTILSPGGAPAADPNSAAAEEAVGESQQDAGSIPGPVKAIIWCTIGGLMAASQMGKVLKLAAEVPALTALSVVAVASVLWSDNPAESWSHGVSLVLSTFLAYFFVAEYEPPEQMQIVVIIGWIAVLGSTLVAVFLPRFGIDQVYNTGEWRGIYAQKNACAAAMLLFLGPVFARKLDLRHLGSVVFGLSVLFVLGMTQSRNGWVVAAALIATMIALRWLARFKVEDRRALFLIAGCLALGGAWVMTTASAALLPLLGRDATFTGRSGIWDAAIAGIKDSPVLGYGFHAFWTGPNSRSKVVYGVPVVQHAHNGMLELALGLGGLGVALFLWSFFKALRDIGVCLRPDRPAYVDWYIATILAVVYFSVAEPFLVLDKSLSWVLYVVSCVGLHRMAQEFRRGDELSDAEESCSNEQHRKDRPQGFSAEDGAIGNR